MRHCAAICSVAMVNYSINDGAQQARTIFAVAYRTPDNFKAEKGEVLRIENGDNDDVTAFTVGTAVLVTQVSTLPYIRMHCDQRVGGCRSLAVIGHGRATRCACLASVVCALTSFCARAGHSCQPIFRSSTESLVRIFLRMPILRVNSEF